MLLWDAGHVDRHSQWLTALKISCTSAPSKATARVAQRQSQEHGWRIALNCHASIRVTLPYGKLPDLSTLLKTQGHGRPSLPSFNNASFTCSVGAW